MKVLLATDGTSHSENAIEMVASLSISSINELRILTVIDMALPLAHDIYTGMSINALEIEKAAQGYAEQALETAKKKISTIVAEGCSISTSSRIGSPESMIVEEAESMKADLIILGSHGYNTWERLLLGSVSDSVVHHAPCSVLVVRK